MKTETFLLLGIFQIGDICYDKLWIYVIDLVILKVSNLVAI